jgi:hypothetical protein
MRLKDKKIMKRISDLKGGENKWEEKNRFLQPLANVHKHPFSPCHFQLPTEHPRPIGSMLKAV